MSEQSVLGKPQSPTITETEQSVLGHTTISETEQRVFGKPQSHNNQ